MNAYAEVSRRQHRIQCRLDRTRWVRQKIRNAGERLVGFRVEDMQNCPNQQRVTGLLPVIAALQRPFGINENVRYVLRVAYLGIALSDLEERIISGALGIGRIEQKHRPELGTPTRRELEILAFDVV